MFSYKLRVSLSFCVWLYRMKRTVFNIKIT